MIIKWRSPLGTLFNVVVCLRASACTKCALQLLLHFWWGPATACIRLAVATTALSMSASAVVSECAVFAGVFCAVCRRLRASGACLQLCLPGRWKGQGIARRWAFVIEAREFCATFACEGAICTCELKVSFKYVCLLGVTCRLCWFACLFLAGRCPYCNCIVVVFLVFVFLFFLRCRCQVCFSFLRFFYWQL